MLESTLLELSDAAFTESLREFARLPVDGELREGRDLLMTRGAGGHASLNFVIRTGGAKPGPKPLLEQARTYYRQEQRSFTLRLRAHRDGDLSAFLSGRPEYRGGATLGMYREGSISGRSAIDLADCQVQRVKTPSQGHAFTEVLAAAFATVGLDRDTTYAVFDRVDQLFRPHLHAVLVTYCGRPAAAALSLMSHGVAGIYWVGTNPALRGRGLGRLAVISAHNWSTDHGARAVFLQCSPSNEGFYSELGYRRITSYPWYSICADGPQGA